MPPAPPPKKPAKPAEKANGTSRIVMWVVLVAIIGGIAWMVATAPKQKQLVCKSAVPSSLHSFGTCTEE